MEYLSAIDKDNIDAVAIRPLRKQGEGGCSVQGGVKIGVCGASAAETEETKLRHIVLQHLVEKYVVN